MTAVNLTIASAAGAAGIRVTDAKAVGFTGVAATINVPAGYPNFVVGFQNLSGSTTVTIKTIKSGFTFKRAEDLDGNTYPRAAYAGGTTETFVGNWAGAYGIVASFGTGVTGTLVIEAFDS